MQVNVKGYEEEANLATEKRLVQGHVGEAVLCWVVLADDKLSDDLGGAAGLGRLGGRARALAGLLRGLLALGNGLGSRADRGLGDLGEEANDVGPLRGLDGHQFSL